MQKKGQPPETADLARPILDGALVFQLAIEPAEDVLVVRLVFIEAGEAGLLERYIDALLLREHHFLQELVEILSLDVHIARIGVDADVAMMRQIGNAVLFQA